MTRFIPLGGFLGAGKTTTMLAAARLLERQGERVSLITNDQGADLVDTQLAKASGIGGIGEVTGGCFCCRFEDLTTVVTRLTEQVNPTAIIAEAVGSCTDLQATVVRPLRQLYGDQFHIAPTVATELRQVVITFEHPQQHDGSAPYSNRHDPFDPVTRAIRTTIFNSLTERRRSAIHR